MTPLLPKAIERYCMEHTTPLPPLFQELIEETRQKTELPQMLSGAVEGRFLQLLVSLTRASQVLEIGTFTGFSALMMAEALDDGGKLLTLECNPLHAKIAQTYFQKSPHGKKIELRLAPALSTLAQLEESSFDFAFIDADKENYPRYFEECLRLLRPRGVVVIDNVLWSGRVLDPKDAASQAIASCNEKVKSDSRVDAVMLSIRDGILLAQKRLHKSI